MGKLNYKLIYVALIISQVFNIGCRKEQGCTDPTSKNYSVTAEIDNGSCTYEGSAVFWYNETTSNRLINDGAISLIYYVDGKIVGSSAANIYWTGAPDCGQNGSVSLDKDIGNNKSQKYSYSVKDQTGWEFWGGTISIYADRCSPYELSASTKKESQ